jgi:cytochrome c oxidase cbb3-type subunit 2
MAFLPGIDAGVVLLIVFAFCVIQPSTPVAGSESAVERGRVVYISEGCIRCHSPHVSPNMADGVKERVVESRSDIHGNAPAIQAPDLTQVGARRSALWLKMHLQDPREVSGTSMMPSYRFLFQDRRGNDLVAYLWSLRGSAAAEHRADEQRWHLSAEALGKADADDGRQLYARYCATCHNGNGRTRLKWKSEFIESPAILRAGSLQTSQSAGSLSAHLDHIAQIIKFGIPDSDMAGHEYLPDKDIASLCTWLTQKTVEPVRNGKMSKPSGEKP